MVGWHHWLDGHEFEQGPGDSGGQRSLVSCSPRGGRESDTTVTEQQWSSLFRSHTFHPQSHTFHPQSMSHNSVSSWTRYTMTMLEPGTHYLRRVPESRPLNHRKHQGGWGSASPAAEQHPSDSARVPTGAPGAPPDAAGGLTESGGALRAFQIPRPGRLRPRSQPRQAALWPRSRTEQAAPGQPGCMKRTPPRESAGFRLG